jgi:GT2 family glycosyltransferase
VLMNNDVECVAPDWLSRLLAACADPAVGVAGAMLLYADGSVQHAGVLVGPGPAAVHRWSDGAESGSRPVTAVTGACMAFRRAVFDRLGGLDATSLPVTWNDLDFCLRAREAGFEVRLECDSVLRHDELGTRTPDTAIENQAQLACTRAYIARRHRHALRCDRGLHPLLTLRSGGRLLDVDAAGRLWRLLRGGGMN